MKTNPTNYRGYRFPAEIISHGGWLYHRFCLSFRDVEELLAKRGIHVSYETIRQWCRKWTCGGFAILSRLWLGPSTHAISNVAKDGWAISGTSTRSS